MNYFDHKQAAERYQKGRPDFHSLVMDRLKVFLRVDKKLAKALDVACGTGLSTKALFEVAEDIYGSDSSLEMLRYAIQTDKIRYVCSPAESQPFPDKEFDLITVCSGIHWFDIDKFLREAYRLLKPGCCLLIYDNFFRDMAPENAAFTAWYQNVYLKKFPPPPRKDEYDWRIEHLAPFGLVPAHEENFMNEVTFSAVGLVLYFTTQSNVISKVLSGETTFEEAEEWLKNELQGFFEHIPEFKFEFGNKMMVLERSL